MKKLILLSITLLLCLLLTACAGEKEEEEKEKDDKKTEDTSVSHTGGTDTPTEPDEPEVYEPEYPEEPEEPVEPVDSEPQTYTLTVEGITFENGTSTLTLAPDEEYTIVAGNREKAAFLYFTDGNGTIITHKNTLPVKMAQNLYIKAVYAEMGEGELEFNTEDGKTYYVAGIGSVSGDTVIIPETFNGKPVDKIAITAFKDNVSLKKVVIPDSVTSIGAEAFGGCTSLEYINIPSTVKDFDFSDIKNYPLKVLSVGIDLPEDFTSPTLEAIFINEGVITVSLKNSSNLRYASLPTTLKFIPDEAFKGCSSLTKISIPTGVEKIGKNAFQNCSSLLSVKFSEGLREIGEWAFDECSSLRALSFPSTLTKIKPYAFRMCKSVQTISFAEGLKTVDEAAFFFCESVREIKLPDTLEAIGASSFEKCSAMTKITFGKNLKTIGNASFARCFALSEIGFNERLETLGTDVFSECTSLSSVAFPQGIFEIGEDTFKDCTALTTVRLPDALYSVNAIFENCPAMTSLYVSANTNVKALGIPESATVYYNGTQSEWLEKSGNGGDNVLGGSSIKFQADTLYDFETGFRYTSNGDGTCRIGRIPTVEITQSDIRIPEKSPNGETIVYIDKNTFPSNNIVTSVIIDAPITVITRNTFSYCNMLDYIILPSTLKVIEERAFSGTKIASVIIPEGVEIIGDYAFDMCQSLKGITLPGTLERIGTSAFHLTALEEVTIPENVVYVGQNAFNTSKTLKKATVDSVNTRFDAGVFTNAADTFELYYTRGVEGWLTLNFDYSLVDKDRPVYINGAIPTEITVPESITKIGTYSFTYIPTVTKINLHDGITTIGWGAFASRPLVEEVKLTNNLTSIESIAFANTTINRIFIPKNCPYVSNDTFRNTGIVEAIYEGTREEWVKDRNLSDVTALSRSVVWYSEAAPTQNGKYWHYVDGVVTIW